MAKLKYFHFLLALGLFLALTACVLQDDKSGGKEQPTQAPVIGSSPSPGPTEAGTPSPSANPGVKLKKKPNIVEVLVDDMRYDDLQYMPELSKLLRREGVFMANMFSNYPLCCPARSSFLSGMLTHNHKVYAVSPPYGYRSFDDRSTVATSLQAEGYQTALFGKLMNGYGVDYAKAPVLAWEDSGRVGPKPKVQSQYYVPDGWTEWRSALQGVYCQPACGGAYSFFDYAYSHNGKPTSSPAGLYSSDVMSDQAIEVSEKFSKKKNPFFLSVNYVAPHNGGGRQAYDPYRFKSSSQRCFAGAPAAPQWAYGTPQVRNAKPMGTNRNLDSEKDLSDKPGIYKDRKQFSRCDKEALVRTTKSRAAALVATDRGLGKLVQSLKDSGEWRNTLFVFWSDNGYFNGEHGRKGGKGIAYEPSLRVPLLFAGPLVNSKEKGSLWGSSERFALVGVPDLTATLLDFAGAEPPHLPDGVSYRALLETAVESPASSAVVFEAAFGDVAPGEDPTDREHFPGVFDGEKDPRKTFGVRTGRYTYVLYDTGERELYDLWQDPHQWNNLAVDEQWVRENRATVTALEKAALAGSVCKGPIECRPALPAALTVNPDELRRTTVDWWKTVGNLHRTDHR